MFHKILQDAFEVEETQNLENDIISSMKSSPQTGLIIFGPTSSKSTLIKKYCQSYEKPIVRNFNPSSVDLKYFMGETVFGRWQYGIVEKSARQSPASNRSVACLRSVVLACARFERSTASRSPGAAHRPHREQSLPLPPPFSSPAPETGGRHTFGPGCL